MIWFSWLIGMSIERKRLVVRSRLVTSSENLPFCFAPAWSMKFPSEIEAIQRPFQLLTDDNVCLRKKGWCFDSKSRGREASNWQIPIQESTNGWNWCASAHKALNLQCGFMSDTYTNSQIHEPFHNHWLPGATGSWWCSLHPDRLRLPMASGEKSTNSDREQKPARRPRFQSLPGLRVSPVWGQSPQHGKLKPRSHADKHHD